MNEQLHALSTHKVQLIHLQQSGTTLMKLEIEQNVCQLFGNIVFH